MVLLVTQEAQQARLAAVEAQVLLQVVKMVQTAHPHL
jgi:hypothetical protein